MLPWWSNSYRIALTPNKVVLVKLNKGWRPKVASKTIAVCEPNPERPLWEAALNTLNEMLADRAVSKGEASVILSNHFVRYVIVPWHPELTGDEERLALVQNAFNKIYGNVVDSWSLRLSDSAYGAPAIASAVDQQLLSELRNIFEKSKLRLRQIQPCLMPIFNQFSKRFDFDKHTCFVFIESGRICISFLKDKKWEAISARRIEANWPKYLGLIVRQEVQSLGLGEMPDTVLFFAPEEPEVNIRKFGPIIRQLKLRSIEGFSAITDTPYAMAMCGMD